MHLTSHSSRGSHVVFWLFFFFTNDASCKQMPCMLISGRAEIWTQYSGPCQWNKCLSRSKWRYILNLYCSGNLGSAITSGTCSWFLNFQFKRIISFDFLLFQNQIKFIFLGENVLHFSLWTSVCYPYLIFFCSFIFFVDYKTKLKKENSEIQTSKENKTNI